MRAGTVLAAILLASGCGNIPRDPERTTQRIHKEGIFRVGLVVPGGTIAPRKQAEFLRRVATASNAKPMIKEGPAEVLLEELEEGKLDVVLGEFSTKTPWAKAVSFMPPLAEKVTTDGHSLLAAAVRNGENQWVGTLHREAVAVAGAVQ